MNLSFRPSRSLFYEILYQVLLLGIVFIFYSFDRVGHGIETRVEGYEIAFFLNYTLVAFVINYGLLPKYLYRKKYGHFFFYLLVLIVVMSFVEEGVLERIYFPTNRGTDFPGVFYELWDAIPTITILAGFKFAWDALKKQRELEEIRSAVKESELQFLRSQINPHFLFNNLNNLYSYALEGSSKTPEIILELSSVLRYVLYECQTEYVSLEKEIQHLKDFVKLSELQLEGRSKIDFSCNDIASGFFVAPLIFLVFIENAFKHSMSSLSENIRISIAISLTEDVLHFRCENTFSEESNIKSLSSGIGLDNVKRRLRILYPKSHELSMEKESGIYKVFLKMKLHKRNGR
ncbi:sensor histidine kinase [Parapedobacter tibetensis]|uniref:sensor histidine kinase n=1 Tax=Parapedobacter tibetensis TaxID=2972951 RepID=UPI00214DB5E6|nr:histidine kinase [Parapedobacter tibetensis]